jgi:hypothetical protein
VYRRGEVGPVATIGINGDSDTASPLDDPMIGGGQGSQTIQQVIETQADTGGGSGGERGER